MTIVGRPTQRRVGGRCCLHVFLGKGKTVHKALALTFAALLLASLAAVGLASAAQPTVVRAGNLVLRLNGDVAPKTLPKKRMAPIALRISGNIANADGSHPPAAKLVV